MIPPPADARAELDPNRPGDLVILQGLRSQCTPTSEPGCLAYVEWAERPPDDPTLIVRGVLAGEPRIPGAVGRWLDSLPTDVQVIVPAVVSGRLAGMLERRGFRPTLWFDAGVGLYDNAAYRRRPD